jgi:hypothetical protein
LNKINYYYFAKEGIGKVQHNIYGTNSRLQQQITIVPVKYTG